MTMPYLRRECSKVLNDWFSANLDKPYPSTQVKRELQRTSVRSYKIRAPAQHPLVRPFATHNRYSIIGSSHQPAAGCDADSNSELVLECTKEASTATQLESALLSEFECYFRDGPGLEGKDA